MLHGSLLLVAACFFAQPPAEAWQSVTLIEANDLRVRLHVKKQASLADGEWLSLEITNTGSESLTIRDAGYRLESERADLTTGKRVSSGSLASGNTYDLFPEAWKTTPVSKIVLEPKATHRVDRQPSGYSAALLRMPPGKGFRVSARAFLSLTLQDGRRLDSPRDGVAFTFDWIPPDAEGIKTLRAKLKEMLQAPESKATHGYLLETYLGIPELAGQVAKEELLEAVKRRTGGFDGREALVRHIANRVGRDPIFIAYYLERLQAGDGKVVFDMYLYPQVLWDRSFIEPLGRLYEAKPSEHRYALSVLHAHREDWRNDAKLIARLSTTVRGHYPMLERNVAELKNMAGVPGSTLERWAEGAEDLSKTGDLSAIELLRPALDDRRQFRSLKWWAPLVHYPGPPLRTCDAALHAILTMLDGDPRFAYEKAGAGFAPKIQPNAGERGEALDAAFAETRDKLIVALKKRLDERAKKPGK